MVGEGVLEECLQHPSVSKVLVVGRRPCGVNHPKLSEIVHKDFYDLIPIESQLKGYDGCLFCLGTTSIGKKEPEFYKQTYTLTMHFATIVSRQNQQMTFCYISGAGTDSTEKGNRMWARVKGKTENDLKKLPFKSVYNFRPGVMEPAKGAKNVLSGYKYVGWLMPVLRVLFKNFVCTLREVGIAMINAVIKGYEKDTIEVQDIKELAKR